MYQVAYNKALQKWEVLPSLSIDAKSEDAFDRCIEATQERDSRNEGQTITCKDCHDIFALSQSEIDWYATRSLELPKRCKSCRQRRKRLVNARNNTDTEFE